MSAVIELVPQNDHGRELLDELEERTEERPFITQLTTGARTYHLDAQDVGVDGFDAMLARIDPDWRGHLTRTGA